MENAKSGKLEGIVPFLLIKSGLTGKRLVSLPLTSYCNSLIPKSKIPDVINFILQYYPDIDYIEIKSLEDFDIPFDSCEKQRTYSTHILNLDTDLDELFRSFHYTSVRQRITRAEKSNVVFRLAEDEQDLKKFYKLETKVRKKHGLPPQPYRFFTNMWNILKPLGYLFVPVVEYKGRVIGAATVLRFKNTFHLEYSASDKNFLPLCPNQKLIWETIKIAHKDGARYFDFGRSSLTNYSLVEFKERWGAKRQFLNYCYFSKTKKTDFQEGTGRKIVGFINRYLPDRVLQLEGKLIYPHLG